MSDVHEAEIVLEVAESSAEPEVMDVTRARYLTDQIRQGLELTWGLIVEVYSGQAWIALGHSSWNEYCTRELGNQHLAKALPRQERDSLFGELRDAGLSLRAISSATGSSKDTVSRALNRNSTVANATVGGIDANLSDDDVASPEPKANPEPTPKPVRGINGKTYKPTAPKPAPPVAEEFTAQDASPEDMGIFPIDVEREAVQKSTTRLQTIKKLTGTPEFTQAALPMVIKLAGELTLTANSSEDIAPEDAVELVGSSSKAVLVLTDLLKSVKATLLTDTEFKLAIAQDLELAQEKIDEFLTTLMDEA